jgi:hypothetical protein
VRTAANPNPRLKVALRAYKADWKDQDKLNEAVSSQQSRSKNDKRGKAGKENPAKAAYTTGSKGWIKGWTAWTQEAALVGPCTSRIQL